MAFQLLITKKAERSLDRLPESYQIRIRDAMRSILSDPYSGKKLSGNKKGQYSVRVWPYRIIYMVVKRELIVVVIDVGHRQGVYE